MIEMMGLISVMPYPCVNPQLGRFDIAASSSGRGMGDAPYSSDCRLDKSYSWNFG